MAIPSPISVLVVDDEAAQATALCNTLGDQGYETVGLTSAEEALAVLREREFDLLLTDLMMPGMDGIALLRAALEVRPDLVAILMTGQGTIGTAVEAMQVGALDYILKPFTLSTIIPVIRRAFAVRQLRLEKAALEQRVMERTRELEVANADLEAFSYSVSHDLRAPLRAITGFSDALLADFAGQMSSEASRLLSQVHASARRMEQLIADLLRLSRLGRQAVIKRPVQMTALVHEALAELRADIAHRAVSIRVGDLPGCCGDAALLKQVFANLLSNAFKFTRQRENTIVEIGSTRDGAQTIYFVRDNGVGFDMTHAARLFGVFQRLHSQDAFEGTGIGLSIVQRIVERHGGRLWAEGAVELGATFYFTLG